MTESLFITFVPTDPTNRYLDGHAVIALHRTSDGYSGTAYMHLPVGEATMWAQLVADAGGGLIGAVFADWLVDNCDEFKEGSHRTEAMVVLRMLRDGVAVGQMDWLYGDRIAKRLK